MRLVPVNSFQFAVRSRLHPFQVCSLWSAGVFFHRTNHVQFSFFESTKRDLLDSSKPEYAKSGRYSPAPFHAISPRYSPYYEIQKDFKDISVPELLARVNLINWRPLQPQKRSRGVWWIQFSRKERHVSFIKIVQKSLICPKVRRTRAPPCSWNTMKNSISSTYHQHIMIHHDTPEYFELAKVPFLFTEFGCNLGAFKTKCPWLGAGHIDQNRIWVWINTYYYHF